jgi:hypothetical protein
VFILVTFVLVVVVLVMRGQVTLIVQREFLEISLIVRQRNILVIFIESKIIFDAVFNPVLFKHQFLLFFILFLFLFAADYFHFDFVRI